MNYGNANDVIRNCPKCTSSIDKHRISLIQSSEKTDALARKMLDLLSKINIQAVLKGFNLNRTSTMVGAAVVTFNNSAKPRQYVTVSGEGVLLLKHIPSMGKDVVVIDDKSALIEGKNNIHKIRNIENRLFDFDEENPGKVVPMGTEYPVGSCAAQKLLAAIFRIENTATIKTIEMSEIMWRALGIHPKATRRQWSTGETVPSCKTCKQVVPQMLCNLYED